MELGLLVDVLYYDHAHPKHFAFECHGISVNHGGVFVPVGPAEREREMLAAELRESRKGVRSCDLTHH